MLCVQSLYTTWRKTGNPSHRQHMPPNQLVRLNLIGCEYELRIMSFHYFKKSMKD